jgi:hypothetical protein
MVYPRKNRSGPTLRKFIMLPNREILKLSRPYTAECQSKYEEYSKRNTIMGCCKIWASECRRVAYTENDVDINSRSISGRAPIFWPSAYGYKEIVRLLVRAGAHLNFQDDNGETAISMARKYGHGAVLNILEQSGRCLEGNAL